jgi:hypothetical protein
VTQPADGGGDNDEEEENQGWMCHGNDDVEDDSVHRLVSTVPTLTLIRKLLLLLLP